MFTFTCTVVACVTLIIIYETTPSMAMGIDMDIAVKEDGETALDAFKMDDFNFNFAEEDLQRFKN